MGKKRRKLSQSEEVMLVSEVRRKCPLCGRSLYENKNGRSYKRFEMAHIYPLNPTEKEHELLLGVGLADIDPNHTDNLIPLCPNCHLKYDHPRTLEEYKTLVDIKDNAKAVAQLDVLQSEYPLMSAIRSVLAALVDSDCDESASNLSYDAKAIESKVSSALPKITVQKIKTNVRLYFFQVNRLLSEIDANEPGSVDMILSQVRSYYCACQVKLGADFNAFEAVVLWLQGKSKNHVKEASEIVASFFVQNCEVYG